MRLLSRRLGPAAAAALFLGTGYFLGQVYTSPLAAQPAKSGVVPAAGTAPAEKPLPADKRVVAYVYGSTPITREEFGDYLVTLLRDEKKHDAVRLYAVKALRDYLENIEPAKYSDDPKDPALKPKLARRAAAARRLQAVTGYLNRDWKVPMDPPKDILDASRMDGVGPLRRVFAIDIPLLLPQFRIVVILSGIYAVQNFVPILLLTNGGPGTATLVPGLDMYQSAFQNNQYGYGMAIGTLLFVAMLIFTLIATRLLRPRTA